MTGHQHDLRPNRKKHSRRKGFWRRFLIAILWLSAIGLVGAGGVFYAGYHSYKNRAEYVNRYLESLSTDYDVTIGSLVISEIGNVDLVDFAIKSKGQAKEIFTSPLVQVTYDWLKFNETRKLDSVLIKSPSLYIDEETLTGIQETTANSKKNGIDLTGLVHFTGSFEVEEGDLFLDLPTAPPIHARWVFKTDQLGYAKDGMTKNPFETGIRKLEIGDEGVFGTIEEVNARWRFNSNLSKIQIEELELLNPSLSIMPEWITLNQSNQEPVKPIPGQVVEIDHLLVKNADIKVLGFDGVHSKKIVPAMAFKTGKVEWEDLFVRDGKLDSKGPVDLNAYDIVVGGGREDLVSADYAEFRADTLGTVIQGKRITSVKGRHVDVLISDDSLSLWREKPERLHKSKAQPFYIDRMELPDTDFLMRDYVSLISRKPMPRVETDVSTVLHNIRFDRAGMHLKGKHSAEIENFVIHGPGVAEGEEALMRLPVASLKFDWERFMFHDEIEVLKMEQPFINVTDTTLGEWAEPPNYADRPIGPVNRPVFKFRELEVIEGALEADSRLVFDGMIPKVKGSFSLKNERVGQSLNEFGYRLEVSELQMSNHPHGDGRREVSDVPSLFPDSVLPGLEPLKSEEVIKVSKAYVDFTAAGIQRQRRIKKVTLDGGILRVGAGLKDVVKKPGKITDIPDLVLPSMPEEVLPLENPLEYGLTETPPGKEYADFFYGEGDGSAVSTSLLDPDMFPIKDDFVDPDPESLDFLLASTAIDKSPEPSWQIDDLEISGGKVKFDSLIPEMSGLSFGLETKMKDIPLSSEGLLDAYKLQSVKLDSLEIRDPYDSFLVVAELPDVFVEFSLAGLAQQEIESIELIAPVLNVGESLFRWVDYLRNYRAINEGATVDLKSASIIDDDLEGKRSSARWVINTINATSGKLVIAPYGTPITSLPFPFSATTNVDEGKVKFEMNISEEQTVFKIPDYGIDLVGLEGDIDFNLPVPEKSNNLVQTFRLKSAKWRKFDADELFLTVTFDRYGIYGLFGGKAYDGYTNGAFNYYLDKDGKWDAWMTGTNLDTEKLTRAMIPHGFVMEGKVNSELYSKGKDSKVDGVEGTLKSDGGGSFDIALMEKMLEHLPEHWSGLQKGFSKIAVDNLRRFDYDQGNGEVFLHDQDGVLKLRFDGEYGSRTINLHIHDWRNAKGKLAGAEVDGEP
ncbi:MAG: hypothetical protein P1V20_26895 [Verrucomicrobiales bacterium]|nr:hypothetical protein [Verrucomicrobiales bacterium]